MNPSDTSSSTNGQEEGSVKASAKPAFRSDDNPLSSNPAGAVGGAAAGAAAGAVGGLAAGPVGSLTGMVVGGVAGALGGSQLIAGKGSTVPDASDTGTSAGTVGAAQAPDEVRLRQAEKSSGK